MMNRAPVLRTCLLAFLAATTLAGCGASFVDDAARNSIASFAVEILTTAVNNTIKP